MPRGGTSTWLLLGVFLLVLGLGRKVSWEVKRRGAAALLLVVSVLGIIWLHSPFRAAFSILAIASAGACIPLPPRVRNTILPGLWAAGAVLVVQAAAIPLLYIFSARFHGTDQIPGLHDWLPGYPSFPWLSYLLYLPLRILNGATTISGPTLYLPTDLDSLPLTPTWEKLGLFPLVLFAMGGGLLLCLRPDWRRRLPGFLLGIALYAYLRLVFLFLLVNQVRKAEIFWSFDNMFYGFLPLLLLLMAWWRSGSPRTRAPDGDEGAADEDPRPRGEESGREEAPTFPAPSRARRVAVAAFVLAGGLTAFFGFHDPGAEKQGRVLIDERHSNWEWTTQPFDTTWYGGKSGYNYYCLADYWNHFYRVESSTDSLTPDHLSRCDVLVLKTPTSPFSPDEVEAILDFVRRGGGLFLIGDHTNVFGTSTYLNQIAERFGMYFRYDASYTLETLGLNLFERPKRFPHPVVRFMPKYLFATSCTLYSPPLSENVILGYGLRAMYLDYSEKSYFPTKEGKMDYDFGLFVQAGGVKYGKGRVLGYTDSTCFSNFFMFIPGKPELALGSLEWLNRTNRWSWLNLVLLLAAGGGLLLLFFEAKGNSAASFWSTTIASGTLALVLLGWATEWSVSRSYAPPEPKRPLLHVTFDQRHGNYVLPAENLAVTNWQNFQTFYVWTQRLGLVPRNLDSLEEAVTESAVLVEIHPFRSFTIEELDLIMNFVQRGGTLLVLDSPENRGSTADGLLGPFSVSFDREAADSVAVLDAGGDTLGVVPSAWAVKECSPLLKLADGRTAMGYRNFGRGKVVACGASFLFNSVHMGNTAVVPNEIQSRVFRVEYDLFQKVAGLKVRGRYRIEDGPDAGGPLPLP